MGRSWKLSSCLTMWPETLKHLWQSVPTPYKLLLLTTMLSLCAYAWKKMFLGRPKLRGRIISQLVTSRLGSSDAELFVARVMLRVRVVNKRNLCTTIQCWSLKAIHEGNVFLSQSFLPQGGRFAGRPISINEKMLEPYCSANRLEYGAAIEGVLFFEFPGIGRDIQNDTKLVLTATDSLGRTHKIAKGNLKDFPRE
jgi:hypothetical protein